MGDFPGADTVYLVTDVPVSDVRNELMQTQTTESVVRVEGCVFEQLIGVAPDRYEQVGVTTNTSEPRWAFLPVVDGQVPGFDEDDNPVLVSPPTSQMRVRYGGRDWQIRADSVIEIDLDGAQDHVFAMCERQKG